MSYSYIRAGAVADALAIVPFLRQADLDEIDASSPFPADVTLEMSAKASSDLRAWVLKDQLAAVGGVYEISPGVGSPWLVGTDATFGDCATAFARLSRSEMDRWNSLWPVLEGYVYAGNTKHVRWLKWCGFELAEPIAHGHLREPFHPFSRRR